jgi:hypothetical protein
MNVARPSSTGPPQRSTGEAVPACHNDRQGDEAVIVTQTQSPGDLYSQAQEDPAFLNAVRDAYTGGHDVLDALWWESHPTDAAPSGVPSPTVALSELKHRLFAADGGLLGDEEATQEMRDLEAQIAADRLAIQHAIAVATRKKIGQPVDEGVEPRGEVQTASMPLTRRRMRAVLVASGVVAALVCGLIIGNQARGSTEPDAPLAALDVFEREQVLEDLPVQTMPKTLRTESFRELLPARFSWTRHTVYVATDMRDMVCLIALTSEQAHVSTCAREEEFPAAGLQLSWSGTVGSQDLGGRVISERAQLYVIWMPDGSVVSTGSST